MTAIADQPTSTGPSGTEASAWARLGAAALKARELSIVLAIILVFVITTLKNSGFANAHSVQQLMTGASLIALLSVGETLVVITRNVDLSVGSVLGFSAYLVGKQFVDHPHMPLILGFVIGTLAGAVFGAINGLIVTLLRVPSLVVTLAALYIIRGLDAKMVNAIQIQPSSIPGGFKALGYKTIIGIPWLFIIVAIIVVIVNYAMRSFRASRELYAIGSNPDAAELAGIPTLRRVFSAFLISGALAGFGGALFLSEFATVDSTAGTGYELLVVAAVVVGGVAIFGGSGTVIGAALGAILLNTITQALVASKVSAFWNQAIAGALLLLAISFDRWLALRSARRAATAEGAHSDI
jgi:rhamnose transport system permease protein